MWRRARYKALLVATLPGLHTVGALGFAAADLVGEFTPPAGPPDFEALRRFARPGHDAMLWSIDIHETCERALPGDQLVAYTARNAGILLEFRGSWRPNHVALYAPFEPFIPASTV